MDKQQQIFDEIINDALDALRLTSSEKRRIANELKKLEREILSEISLKDLAAMPKQKLEKLIEDLGIKISKSYQAIREGFNIVKMGKLFTQAAVNSLRIVLGPKAVKIPSNFIKLLEDDLLIFGNNFKEAWSKESELTKLKFAAQIRLGAINGEPTAQIARRISGTLVQPGVMDISKSSAFKLAHDSVQTISNLARRKTFEENLEVVEGIKQVSTLDSHTSKTCVAYSGAEWNMNYEPINGNKLAYNGGCPRHIGCRSVEIPILKSLTDLGFSEELQKLNDARKSKATRASETGQIAIDTTFEGYLNRRGVAYQNKVLGVGIADLWRKGKITLSDLVTKGGRELTLKELEELVAKRTK